MNQWHWDQEKERLNRNYRDLEFRFHNLERERDDYKNKYHNTVKLLSDKTVEHQNFKDTVCIKLDDLKYEISNL